jgi:hypothetical protein
MNRNNSNSSDDSMVWSQSEPCSRPVRAGRGWEKPGDDHLFCSGVSEIEMREEYKALYEATMLWQSQGLQGYSVIGAE